MSAFGGVFLTNKGRNLQVKAQTGTALTFTRMAIGDGSLGGSLIVDLNALKNEKKSLPITKLKTQPDGQAVVGTVIKNDDITSGFYLREIGVFAQDPDLGEILYCYANAGATAEYIPAGGGTDIIEKTLDIITIVGNAQNVSAVINQSLIYETPEGAQEKADQAEQNANDYTDQRVASIVIPVQSVNGKTGAVSLTASDVGAETPAGAQAKANTAETNAKNYAVGLSTIACADTRSTNELPSYYLTTSNGKKMHVEFKQRTLLALPSSSGNYCTLITLVQWVDSSGGTVKQIAYDETGRAFIRYSNGTSAWYGWQEFETTAGAQTKANTAESNAKTYTDQQLAAHTAEDASLTQKGHVQLSSDTNSTSETLAATPKAVKAAYDLASTVKADIEILYWMGAI